MLRILLGVLEEVELQTVVNIGRAALHRIRAHYDSL